MEEVEDVVTVALFALLNVRDILNNQVVAVLDLHVVANVPQSVRGIQKVVVAQVLHVVLNARQSVRVKRHKPVRIAPMVVLQDVVGATMIVITYVEEIVMSHVVHNVEANVLVHVNLNALAIKRVTHAPHVEAHVGDIVMMIVRLIVLQHVGVLDVNDII